MASAIEAGFYLNPNRLPRPYQTDLLLAAEICLDIEAESACIQWLVAVDEGSGSTGSVLIEVDFLFYPSLSGPPRSIGQQVHDQ